MARVTSEYINKQNKITILRLIRESGTISRADAAKATGISAPTVTRIVDDLINSDGLVIESGVGDSGGGRPPSMISFHGKDKYIIGVDLSPQKIYGVLTDLNSNIISEVKLPSGADEGFDAVMNITAEVIFDLIRHSRIPEEKLLGVGLGIPGFHDLRSQSIVESPVFKWHDVDPKAALKSAGVEYPVIYDNIGRVLAMGELYYGSGKDYKNLVCLKIGYGIGGGVILDGNAFYGSRGFSGELGHTTIDQDSEELCTCGNSGCLEALASGRYFLKKIQELDDQNLQEDISLEEGIRIVLSNPERYRSVLDHISANLAKGVLNAIHTFDPEAVIIGGKMSELGDLLLEPIRHSVARRAITRFDTDVPIRTAFYGHKAVAMGAVSLILNRILKLEIS